jgi:hypothetical protein
MQMGETTVAGIDDGPLDAWLRHALQQSFKATLREPLPADLLALAAGQPQLRRGAPGQVSAGPVIVEGLG